MQEQWKRKAWADIWILLRQDQRYMSASLLASFWQDELLVHALSWLICWSTFMLLLLWLWCPYAIACCGTANATAVTATAAMIAAIAKDMFLWFMFSKMLFSIIVYLNCFTTTVNTIGEIVDIFKLWYILQKDYGRVLKRKIGIAHRYHIYSG